MSLTRPRTYFARLAIVDVVATIGFQEAADLLTGCESLAPARQSYHIVKDDSHPRPPTWLG